MTFVHKIDGTVLTIPVEGRLDTITAPELEKDLENSLDGVTELVFDFQRLEYISSAGLRVLMFAKKSVNPNASVKIINVSPAVREVLEITGMGKALTFA
jgi:anti-sigma B factor antagonist